VVEGSQALPTARTIIGEGLFGALPWRLVFEPTFGPTGDPVVHLMSLDGSGGGGGSFSTKPPVRPGFGNWGIGYLTHGRYRAVVIQGEVHRLLRRVHVELADGTTVDAEVVDTKRAFAVNFYVAFLPSAPLRIVGTDPLGNGAFINIAKVAEGFYYNAEQGEATDR